jgi:hypothetical protein
LAFLAKRKRPTKKKVELGDDDEIPRSLNRQGSAVSIGGMEEGYDMGNLSFENYDNVLGTSRFDELDGMNNSMISELGVCETEESVCGLSEEPGVTSKKDKKRQILMTKAKNKYAN